MPFHLVIMDCSLAGKCFFDGWCSPATWSVKLPGWRSNLNL